MTADRQTKNKQRTPIKGLPNIAGAVVIESVCY